MIPDYKHCIDWSHCENIKQACTRLSEITQILNRLIMISSSTEKELILQMAEFGSEIPEKLSMTNKLIKLAVLNENCQSIKDLISLYFDSNSACSQVRLKREAILEDLNALKKIEGIRGEYS